MTRTIIAVAVLALTAGTASAQAAGTFSWKTYVGINGNPVEYPQWALDPGGTGKTYLAVAFARYFLATGVVLDEAKLNVYETGAVPGSWAATPKLTVTTNQIPNPVDVPNTMGMVKEWSIGFGWADGPPPTKLFTNGQSVKLEIVIKTTQGGVQSTSVLGTTYVVTATPR
jgi:hypothetical protein